jgi:hypothetical protein
VAERRDRWQAAGHHGPGRKSERRILSAAQGSARAQWAAEGRGPKLFFLLFYLQNTVLLFFAQILGNFHIVFSIQIIPTKKFV